MSVVYKSVEIQQYNDEPLVKEADEMFFSFS